jgi:hypothetical protein
VGNGTPRQCSGNNSSELEMPVAQLHLSEMSSYFALGYHETCKDIVMQPILLAD